MFERVDRRYRVGSFDQIPAAREHPDNAAARERYRRFTLHAVKHLPPKQREAIELYFLEALTISEIAERLGVNKSTVSRRLCAGRRTLRDLAELCQTAGLFPS